MPNLCSFSNQIHFQISKFYFKPFHDMNPCWQKNDICLEPTGSQTQWNPYNTFLESVIWLLDKFQMWCTKGSNQNHSSFLKLCPPPQPSFRNVIHMFIKRCSKFILDIYTKWDGNLNVPYMEHQQAIQILLTIPETLFILKSLPNIDFVTNCFKKSKLIIEHRRT